MAAITFKGFRGAVPRVGERLQQARFAKSARNIKITSGNIVPLKGMQPVYTTLASAIKTIWRYRHVAGGATSDNWLTFADDTDVVGSLIANDESGRVYWSSEAHEPRMSVYASAISGLGPYPVAWFMLGVPSPTAKPTLSIVGGSGDAVDRAYAYTFVTQFGEESGPSPASDVSSGYPNATWTVAGMQTAPANSGSASSTSTLPSGRIQTTLSSAFGMQIGTTLTMVYDTVELVTPITETVRLLAVNLATNVVEYDRGGAYPSGTSPTLNWTRAAAINTSGMVKRIYRTEGTDAAFFYVGEVAVATTSFADAALPTAEVIQTINTQPAPAKLKSLLALPNGCLCGLTDNEVCFSDPYLPYSWPIGNRYSFVGRGVAMGASGNSVIVLTDGYPILFTGSDPEAMSPTVIETYAPCVSKRGCVNIGGGVLYPSHDGLWLAGSDGAMIRTRLLYRKDEWQALNPSTFNAEYFDGQYHAVHTPVGAADPQILILDIEELDSAVTVNDFADTLLRNDYDGALYAVKGAQILKWDTSDTQRYFSEWTSVQVQLDQPRNFSFAQVHADWAQAYAFDESILIANRALIAAGPDSVRGDIDSVEFLDLEFNGSYLQRYIPPVERKVQFILLDETGPVFSKTVYSSKPFRLPAGKKQEIAQVSLNTSITVYSATIAESTPELATASQ